MTLAEEFEAHHPCFEEEPVPPENIDVLRDMCTVLEAYDLTIAGRSASGGRLAGPMLGIASWK